MKELHVIGRSPQEVRELLEWANKRVSGKKSTENEYAYGVYATLMYLLGECETPPHKQPEEFALKSVCFPF